MMLAARMAALSRRLQSSASSTSGPKRRVRGEACVRYVLSRPLAGLEGRPAPCLRNPIKKSELEVCAKQAVNYTVCDFWTRSCREEEAPSSLPRFARKASCQTPPQRQIRPERQKAKKAFAGTTEPNRSSRRAKTTTDIAMARQRQTGSYTWTQVKSVQNLIERCLSQYMTQAEVIATLQVQADVDPALTCLVWSKLEEANPDFFLSYDVRLKLKDQIVAFNYLVEQQTRLLQKLTLALPQQGLMD